MKQKRVLSIQDLSCMGKCSLTMSASVLSAMGHEAVLLPTALLSTHTSEFSGYTFLDLSTEMEKIAAHFQSMHVEFDAIYIGYLGGMKQIENAKFILSAFKKENTFCLVDPAMAEAGSLYNGLNQEYVKQMASLCSMADVITPNCTEYRLLHRHVHDCRIIQTGVTDHLQIGVQFEGKSWLKPKFDGQFYGTGDAFASALVGAYLKNGDIYNSIEIALNFVWESVRSAAESPDCVWYGIPYEQNLKRLTD